MTKIRIGSPDYLSVQPLIHGLRVGGRPDVELIHAEPGQLSVALEQRALDIALIPSIEFLRGVGAQFVEGPGLVARGRTGGLLLVTDRPMSKVKRIAVAENSRTPVAVLRILLDKAFHVLPDFCVFKGNPVKWRESFDAILLTGDNGLCYCANDLTSSETCHDLGEMWCELYPKPLLLAVWASHDARISNDVVNMLTESRDAGLQNLSLIAEEAAVATGHDGQVIYDYLSHGWGYHIGRAEQNGLRLLEDHAIEYQLIQKRRPVKALAGHR